ncbi:hypothetical protein Ancab_030521 [Ancistrocladus abbreviatus]
MIMASFRFSLIVLMLLLTLMILPSPSFSSQTKLKSSAISTAAPPAFLPDIAPVLPPYQELSPDITPLLPTLGGGGSEASPPADSSMGFIPSSLSPPNPDAVTDPAVSPFGSLPSSSSALSCSSFSWFLKSCLLLIVVGCWSVWLDGM